MKNAHDAILISVLMGQRATQGQTPAMIAGDVEALLTIARKCDGINLRACNGCSSTQERRDEIAIDRLHKSAVEIVAKYTDVILSLNGDPRGHALYLRFTRPGDPQGGDWGGRGFGFS